MVTEKGSTLRNPMARYKATPGQVAAISSHPKPADVQRRVGFQCTPNIIPERHLRPAAVSDLTGIDVLGRASLRPALISPTSTSNQVV